MWQTKFFSCGGVRVAGGGLCSKIVCMLKRPPRPAGTPPQEGNLAPLSVIPVSSPVIPAQAGIGSLKLHYSSLIKNSLFSLFPSLDHASPGMTEKKSDYDNTLYASIKNRPNGRCHYGIPKLFRFCVFCFCWRLSEDTAIATFNSWAHLITESRVFFNELQLLKPETLSFWVLYLPFSP